MKTRLIAIFLLAALVLSILSGCVSVSARQPDAPVNSTEAPVSDVPRTANEPTEAPKPQATETPADRLTRETAISIALEDAGLAENQVTRLKAEFGYDDGRPEYDVEFRQDGWEYEYEIHAETGKILSRSKELDD